MVEISERVRKQAGLDGAADDEFTDADDAPIDIDS
jgi:hypothetical protein